MLANCHSAQKSGEKNKWFQSSGSDCLVSRYSVESEEKLARNEVRIGVPHSKD